MQKEKNEKANRKRFLLINADDFGYCEERDEGILECVKKRKGAISVSLMVNGRSASSAAQSAKELNLSTSLHINLTEGSPISPPQSIPTLVTKDKTMHGKHEFWGKIAAGEISLNDIEREVIAQIELFHRYMGYFPRRVDGHQHITAVPSIFDILFKILPPFGVLVVRVARESDLGWEERSSQFLKTVSENSRSILNKFPISFLAPPSSSPNSSPDSSPPVLFTTHHFLGLSTMGAHINTKCLSNPVMANMPSGHSVEWMVHPGRRSRDYGDDFSRSEEREREMEEMKGGELGEVLEREGFEMVNFDCWLGLCGM